MPQTVHTTDALPALPVFSQAVISRGQVYVSGTVGCLDDLSALVPGGVQDETVGVTFLYRTCTERLMMEPDRLCIIKQRAALQSISKVLKAAGSGLEHVVKANIYLLHRDRDFAPMNEVYQEVIL